MAKQPKPATVQESLIADLDHDFLPITFADLQESEDTIQAEGNVPELSFTRFSKSSIADLGVVFFVTDMQPSPSKFPGQIYYRITIRTQHEAEGSFLMQDDGRSGQRRALYKLASQGPVGPFLLNSFDTSYDTTGFRFVPIRKLAFPMLVKACQAKSAEDYTVESDEDDPNMMFETEAQNATIPF